MPTFEIKTPEGATYRVTAPDEQAAMRAFQSMQGGRAEQNGEFSFGEAFGRGVGQGFLAGGRDELSAAAAAAPGFLQLRSRDPEVERRFERTRVPGALETIVGGVNLLAETVVPSIFGDEGRTAAGAELERQREMDAQARDEQGAAYTLGTIGGAVANPLFRAAPAPAATAGQRFVQGGRVALPLSAAFGFNEGEGGVVNRLGNAAWAGATGFLTGGALNSAIGPRAAPPPGRVSDVTRASERQSVRTPIVAASDSLGVQRAGMHARNASIFGNPIVQSMDDATDDLGQVAMRAGQRIGGGTSEAGGEAARGGITNWIVNTRREELGRLYDAVDEFVDPSVTGDLAATRQIATQLLGRRRAAALRDPNGGAVSEVLDAVTRPGGLSYEGIKTLRTEIGRMRDTGMLPVNLSKTELDQIYGALTDDLRDIVELAGGPSGLQAFTRANQQAAIYADRARRLADVVGSKGDAPPAAVFDRLMKAAQNRSRADTQMLVEARRVMGPDEWQRFSGSVITGLGRDATGGFSPQRFVTEWGRFSDRGKQLLFDVSGQRETRQALDDIATISRRFVDMQQRYGNPSGTAQSLTSAAALYGIYADPVATIGAGLTANLFSRALAQPATARAMAGWSRAYEATLLRGQTPTSAAMQAETRALAATIGDAFGVSPAQIVQSLTSQLQGNAQQPNGQQVPPVR